MADTRVTIDVDLNTSPAAQGLRDLQRQYNAFTSSLNRNNAAQASASRQYSDQLLRLVNSSQMFTAETVRMQTAAGRLDKTLAKGQVTMGQFFSARFLRDSTAAAQVLSLANARAAALQTQFFATSAAANGMRDAIAVRPYEAFNSALAVSAQKLAIHRAMLMQATTHMINFGKNTQWAGRQLMVGFTVPLTIFGGVAGKVFRELEEQAVNFKKVYGDIFTTEEETAQALDAVQELSKEFTKYGIAVKDTMALAGVAAQSGLRNAELMAATTQATRLATLGQMEQAEAMKTIISLQTAFKTSNEGLAESVDFLNIIENQTVLSLQDVAGAIPRVAPVIQGLGGDVKDLAVLLVAMKEGGVTAGEGANALKSSLGRLIVPTRAAKEMAAEFGISLEQIVENNRGQLIPMIMELGQALNSVGDLEKQQLLSTIFGKFQYARIGALFDSITRDSSQAARAMELMNLSAAELGQIAEKELGVVEESVGARFTAAMEKAKLAIAPLGEAFLNLSIPLINMFTKIVEKFNELPDFAKKFAVFGSVIVGVVIPVGTMFLGLLMNLIGTLIKFGGIIGIAFKGFTSGGIRGAIQAVSQALNYMSLEEIDAANAAQQLGQSTQIVNEALRQQVPRTAEAALGINQLGAAYASLILRMREAAALSATQGGAFVAPGAAADLARKGPRPRGYNNGGKVLKFNDGNTVPGVGNTDTVPAMLTPGEFVVNKQATQDNLGLLQQINDGEVQYRNKGGGIATPGRMFYGTKLGRPSVPTPPPSAEDYVAMAAKGINPLEARATAQAREVGIGGASVSLPKTAPSQARAQAAIKTIEDILEPAKRGAYRVLQKIGLAPTFDTRGSVGYHTRYNQQMKNDNPRGISASLLAKDLRDSRYDSFAVLRKQVDEWNSVNPNNKLNANNIIEKFLKSLDDLGDAKIWDTKGLKSSERLYRDAIGNKKFIDEIDKPYVQDASYPVPQAVSSLSNSGYVRKSLNPITNQKVKVKIDDESKEVVIIRTRGYKIDPKTGKKIKDPKTGKYIEDIISKERLIDTEYYPKPNEFIKDQSGKANIWVNDPVEGLVNLRGLQGEVGRSGSINPALGYKTVETPKIDGLDIQFAHANKGGLIQSMFGGGRVLSRAAQIKRIESANFGTMTGLQDNALSKVLKLRFNDVKGAQGPADFVKGMFSRWETTPTRISPKENTSMLLKGKKPKYAPIKQEDYLTDMIVSLDRFADTADAFKPIKIGTGFDGAFRVFDGHTRLHAQTVKGLIKRLTGKDTSTMSRDEILEGVRLVQQKSLAGELRDADVLRSVAGQRVLSTRAGKREVEVLNERPGKAAPMGSMLNRNPRVLLPEIHGKEIDAIVEAARKANFYGVKKDPDSLMQAMGFISLGGGAKYRYEPGRTYSQPERRSYLKNMSRKILDDLVDSGAILPLRRNKGGIIPGIQYRNDGGEIFESGGRTIVPGVGNTDTVPAMLTPGEFVINKQATQENKPLLQAINSGNVLNKGGKVQFLNAGNPVSDWGDFTDPDKEKKLSKKERFERSFVGRYAERRLAAGDRAGRLLSLAATMSMEAERSGIFVKELADFEKLPQKQQFKERNLRKAEVAAARYEKAVGIWNANGRPAPPKPLVEEAKKLASGEIRAAKMPAGSQPKQMPVNTWADVEPGKLLGFDKNGKPITNTSMADGLLKQGKLYGADGRPLTQVMGSDPDIGKKMLGIMDDDVDSKTNKNQAFKMTRAQKTWAAISALTMGVTASGIALYERNKRDADPLLGYNKGGRVPAMLTPGEFIVDRDKAEQNLGLLHAINNGENVGKYALGGLVAGAAQLALPLGLSLAAAPVGAKAGEAVGGETGAMVGGMAASFLPFMLPWGKILGRGKGASAAAEADPNIRKTTTIAGSGASQVGAASTTTAKSMLASSVQFLKLARIVPLIFNPFTALAAAAIGVTYTLAKMQKSNQEEYKRGQAYADAMTTSAEDIKALGASARDRAKNMDQWLNQSESQFIQEEYAGKIAKAKTKAEKKLLEIERDKAIQERGTMTRREAFEDFYRKDIENAKKRGASQQEISRLYEQRNMALGVQEGTKADFGFDKTFGTEFIKGAGQKDFSQFQMTRDLANQFNVGQVSSAQLETLRRVSDAAYGFTTSVEQVAELDMASKLAQYVLSGTMTQDQAASIAEAIGAELGDLRIGMNIRDELTGIVGAEGQFAKNRPGQVAMQLAEQNERRTKELQEITKRNVSFLLAQKDEDQIQARTKRAQQFDTGAPAGFNLFTQFFSGMADEARRNIGGLIELQSSEFQMLEENIAAVGLAYNDLIAQAKTLAEADRYRYERARSIEKLQERRDELQQERQDMLFGSEQNRQELLKIGMDRINRIRKAEVKTDKQRDRFAEIDPVGTQNFFPNILERMSEGVGLIQSNVENFFDRITVGIQTSVESAMPSSFAQVMTTQLREALVKKYEGTSTGAAINTLIQTVLDQYGSDSPIFAEFMMRALDDEEYASTVSMFMTGLVSQVEEEANRGEISNTVAEGIRNQIENLLLMPGLDADLQARLSQIFSGLNVGQMGDITNLFDMAGDPERTIQLYERFIPLLTKMGDLVGTKLPNLGDKTIIESIFGDRQTLVDLAKNDETMLTLMEFFDTLASIDDDLELRFLEQFKDIPSMIAFMDGVEKIKFKDIVKNIRDARKAFKELSDVDMTPEKAEEFDKYMFGLIERLNNIEDPEIKARLTAEIAPEVLMMQQILQDLPNLQGAELQAAVDTYDDFVQSINARVDTATAEAGEGKKKPSGGGGSKEDPLNDLFRQLRDTADLLSDIGTELLSVNRESKSIFDKLREENVNETVIAYLRSMGPEQAIKVGQEVLGNNKKLNTLMQLVGESEIARQQDAARVAQERNKFVRDMMGTGFDANGFRALSGAPMLDMEAALNDEEFLAGMMAARGTATPNKSMRMFQESYFAKQQAQRRASSSMAPTIVQSQIQQNLAQTYAANELRNRGLSQEEIDTALQSDAIMNRIRTRLEQQKSIGPVITKMAKDLYASTKTIVSILDEGISKVGNVFDFLSGSLDNATQQIDKFTIKPLQDDLEEIQKSNSEMAETQRRLSRSLSLLQKTEADTRERQKEDEEKINESYDLRIEALERVDKINKDIEERQKGQTTVADALSRGDIGAAARAAQEMQAKAAQARREEAIQAMRDQKEEDMQNLKEAHEQELENLTISVNGELLTREQIQERIDDLESKIYDNSLKEYDIQQKINAALEDRRKIEEQIERVGIARQAIAQLQTLNQTTDEGARRQTISSTQQTLQLLGGPESERLIQLINQNMSGLLSIDEPTFGAAIQEVFGGFGPLMATLGTDIGSLNIQIPNIQTALNSAIATVNTELPNIFNGIKTQIDNLNTSINVDPESEDNPFAKVYKAAKKVAKQIEKAFANIKPPAGSGGGAGSPGEGDSSGTTLSDSSEEIRASFDMTERKNLKPIEKTYPLQDGRRLTVIRYYDPYTGLPAIDENGRVITDYRASKTIPKRGQLYTDISASEAIPLLPDNFSPSRFPTRLQQGLGFPTTTADTAERRVSSSLSILAQTYGGVEMPGGWQRGFMPYRSMYTPSENAYQQAANTARIAGAQIDPNQKYMTKSGTLTGEQIFQGIIEGIKTGAINFASHPDVETAVTEYMDIQFGIGSPAKKMFPTGGYIAEGLIKGAVNWFLSPAMFIWDSIDSFFKSETGTTQGDSSKTAPIGVSLLKGMLNGVVSALIPSSLWTPVWTWIKSAFGITSDDGAETEKTKPAGSSIISGIFGGITSFLIPGKLWSTIWSWISGDTTSTTANQNNTSTGNKIISGIFNGITTFLSPGKLWSALWSWISGDTSNEDNQEKLLGVGGEGNGAQKGIMGGIKDGIVQWIQDTPFGQFITDIADAFSSALQGKSIIDALKTVGGAIWGVIADGVIAAIPGGQFAAQMIGVAKQALYRGFGGPIPKMAFGGMVGYAGSREPAPGMMMGGKVKKYAIGGFVPGRGMTDKVPALLTPGEFVVRKSVAQQMMPALKSMNSQVFPGMGIPQSRSMNVSAPQFDSMKKMSMDTVRFGVPQNINSYVYPSTNLSVNQTNMETSPVTNTVGPTNVQYNYNLKVTASTNASPDEIANTVMYKIKRFDDRRIKGTEIG